MDAMLKYENDQLRKRDAENHELKCALYKILTNQEISLAEKVDSCLDFIRRVMCGTE